MMLLSSNRHFVLPEEWRLSPSRGNARSLSIPAASCPRFMFPTRSRSKSRGRGRSLSFNGVDPQFLLRNSWNSRNCSKLLLLEDRKNVWQRRDGMMVVCGAGDGVRTNGVGRSAEAETMELLEWPRVCQSVADFCATALGKKELLEVLLEMRKTREESEALMQQTSAGVEIVSLLGGAFEFGALKTDVVKLCVERVCKGAVVSGPEVVSVVTLLQTGHSVHRSVNATVQEHPDRQLLMQPLLEMVSPMVTHPELVKVVWTVVDEDGSVKDSASPELRRARIQERTLEQRLLELLNKVGRDSFPDSQGQEAVNVDGRFCLAVPADSCNQVSGLLLRSSSGITAYVEPAVAVPLNNKLAEARADVLAAEYTVLLKLTDQLRPFLDDIQSALNIIVGIDVVMARVRYSTWMGSMKPTFIDDDGNHPVALQLLRARHPLLVQQHRQLLKEAKTKLKSKTRVAELEENAPVPIDVRVSQGTKVVAITGPNMGGKTATIKTVGLAALMAKSGLYILAAEPVLLPWFDAILADIGDEQSLSQSLSTFSGHLQRIKRIKMESTGHSLVLLDEVGAGTDPTEGAALGMALLESFAQNGAGGSFLTMATTHHGELKTLKYSDSRFENASVEFDEEKLRPTYRLLWGIPGRSNALNIAERLGLPTKILATARSLYGVASAEISEVIMELEEARRDHDHGLMKAESLLSEAKAYYAELAAASLRLKEHGRLLALEKSDRAAAAAAAARSHLNVLARNVQGRGSTRLSWKSSAYKASGITTGSQASKSWEELSFVSTSNRDGEKVTSGGAGGDVPTIGETVFIPKLGRAAKVIQVRQDRKEITVQSGSLQVKLNLREIEWPPLSKL
ncbi:unnamed protein product [Sphagnum jensenii]|uniref:DNA mismatch repair proteins mutS family domain-containing protein n=1 Tax=Sphagnum jensenii TaxID=128206 RepID=A0ABP0X504_9BRYO